MKCHVDVGRRGLMWRVLGERGRWDVNGLGGMINLKGLLMGWGRPATVPIVGSLNVPRRRPGKLLGWRRRRRYNCWHVRRRWSTIGLHVSRPRRRRRQPRFRLPGKRCWVTDSG